MTLPDNRIGPAGNEADSQHESRTHSDSSGFCSSLRCAMEALELGHRQWLAGIEHGIPIGQRMAAEALAAEILHKQACDALGIATTAALARHGEQWAESIRTQAVS